MPLPRRAPSRFLLLGLFLLLLLLVLNASAFLTYHQVRRAIEEELGQRLLSVATAAAAGIRTNDLVEIRLDPAGPAAQRVQAFLQRVRFETGVGDLYVFDTERKHLLDAEGHYAPGYDNPALELHYAAATAALAGVPEASGLYKVGRVYLGTAFAPIQEEFGEVWGVLAAEGGADFFAGLWSLRKQTLITGAAGMFIVLALALFFARIVRSQALTERALHETSALAAAGELAAILAHEIRNPLAIISSRAERVRAKIVQGKPAEEVLSWFEAIPREIDRLDRTLSQYLSFARPSDPAGEAAPVGPTLDAVLTFLANDLARRGIEVRRSDEEARSARVSMASAALHQVLLNVVLNARDAMSEGGLLEVSARPSGRWLFLRVADTGGGMTDEQKRRAFEMFYTTKPGGSGLGLAVVRSMLDLYGGRVEVDSEVGKGTVLTLWIPAAAAEGAER
jgi:signal transduction histidine kinase